MVCRPHGICLPKLRLLAEHSCAQQKEQPLARSPLFIFLWRFIRGIHMTFAMQLSFEMMH